MVYISVEDFLEKTRGLATPTRQEELAWDQAMTQGDAEARQRLIAGYLPQVAGHISRCNDNIRTLSLVYGCLAALEQAVDRFDFAQSSETCTLRLCW